MIATTAAHVAPAPSLARRLRGMVTSWTRRGWGFAVAEGESYFVHVDDVDASAGPIALGAVVEFSPGTSDRGPIARRVRAMPGAERPALGPQRRAAVRRVREMYALGVAQGSVQVLIVLADVDEPLAPGDLVAGELVRTKSGARLMAVRKLGRDPWATGGAVHERFRQVVARGTAKAEREEREHLAAIRASRVPGPRRGRPPELAVRRSAVATRV